LIERCMSALLGVSNRCAGSGEFAHTPRSTNGSVNLA